MNNGKKYSCRMIIDQELEEDTEVYDGKSA